MSDRDTIYVSDPPKRMFGNILIDGPDGQCIYVYAGIEERCQREAVAHTYIDRGGDRKVVEMCAEHAREDVREPPSTEQQELVTDGGAVEDGMDRGRVRQVVCPHCGTNPPGQCREVDENGPTGEFRDPHPERVELAAEFWDVDRYGKGAVTGQWYRVSEWEDVGNGKMIAKSKEPVDEEDVPPIWRGALQWSLDEDDPSSTEVDR